MLFFNHCSDPRIVEQFICSRSGFWILVKTLLDEALDECAVLEVTIEWLKADTITQDRLICGIFSWYIASEWCHICKYYVSNHS